MNRKERVNRVIARGEYSNHAHIITGPVTLERKTERINGEDKEIILAHVEEGNTTKLRHLLESHWLQGSEIWTKEHQDINLEKGTYSFVYQTEYNPYNDTIERVID